MYDQQLFAATTRTWSALFAASLLRLFTKTSRCTARWPQRYVAVQDDYTDYSPVGLVELVRSLNFKQPIGSHRTAIVATIRNFQLGRYVTPNASSARVLSRMSWYTIVCPSLRMRRHWILYRHEYDVIQSRTVVDDVTNRRIVGTFLYRVLIGHESLNRLVSEIFSIKVADTQTDRQTIRVA